MKVCERCQTPFVCGAENSTNSPAKSSKKSQCWCMELPAANVPSQFKDCLCSNCLNLFATPAEEDFYLDENGNTVFTAAYHLKRGYCCENNCRHCPY